VLRPYGERPYSTKENVIFVVTTSHSLCSYNLSKHYHNYLSILVKNYERSNFVCIGRIYLTYFRRKIQYLKRNILVNNLIKRYLNISA
jgi:hypothetical protein